MSMNTRFPGEAPGKVHKVPRGQVRGPPRLLGERRERRLSPVKSKLWTAAMQRKSFTAVLVGLACLACAPIEARAMSHLIAMSMELVSTQETPQHVFVYKLTAVHRNGQGMLEVDLSYGGLPAGVTVSFSPASLRFTGRVPETQTAYMTITCPSAMQIPKYPFTVTGTAQRESITITNPGEIGTGGDCAGVIRQASLSIQPRQTGGLLISGEGTSSATYTIEAAADLSNPDWKPIATVTADAAGKFYFLYLALSPSTPSMFFRAYEQATVPSVEGLL